MSGYLLDTNVISLFSPSGGEASEDFRRWMTEKETADGLYLSAVTIHEIEKGITLLAAKGATRRAGELRAFLQGLVAGYGERILPVDAGVALEAGRLEAEAVMAGHNPGAADAMIAGTASAHRLTVVTRNIRHFSPFGIAVLSPHDIRY